MDGARAVTFVLTVKCCPPDAGTEAQRRKDLALQAPFESSEVLMTTQFISTSHPLSSSAAAPALRGRQMAHPALTRSIMRPRKRGEGKPIQDTEKLVVDMLPLVKRVALKIRERLPAQVEMDDLVSDGVAGVS